MNLHKDDPIANAIASEFRAVESACEQLEAAHKEFTELSKRHAKLVATWRAYRADYWPEMGDGNAMVEMSTFGRQTEAESL
jgi:hypothetical protein